MYEVTRVFLGASAVLSNGIVYARVGIACVAIVAHALIGKLLRSPFLLFLNGMFLLPFFFWPLLVIGLY